VEVILSGHLPATNSPPIGYRPTSPRSSYRHILITCKLADDGLIWIPRRIVPCLAYRSSLRRATELWSRANNAQPEVGATALSLIIHVSDIVLWSDLDLRLVIIEYGRLKLVERSAETHGRNEVHVRVYMCPLLYTPSSAVEGSGKDMHLLLTWQSVRPWGDDSTARRRLPLLPHVALDPSPR